MTTHRALIIIALSIIIAFHCGTCFAGYEIRSVAPSYTDKPILDVALAPEGDLLCVLSEGGVLTLRSLNDVDMPESQIRLPFNADRLAVAPEGDKLIATLSGSMEIYEVTLDQVADIDVRSAPLRGPETAPVTVVVFSEFQCPYCSAVKPLLSKLQQSFPEEVRIAFKHYPLQRHRYARHAALASIAAQEQGKFWELHDLLFENQAEINPSLIASLAGRAGLDMELFHKAINDRGNLKLLDQDILEAKEAGVRGTPTLFVNGRLVKNRNFKSLQSMVNEELEETADKNSNVSRVPD